MTHARSLASALFIFAALGCGHAPSTPDGGAGDGGAAASHFQKLFMILMENSSAPAIYQGTTDPYLTGTLMTTYAYATNYTNVVHPSEPNYLWLEGGTNGYPDHTFATDDDPSASNSSSSGEHLATLLSHGGHAWKAYEEGMGGATGACPIHSANNCAAKHDPFVFFQDLAGSAARRPERGVREPRGPVHTARDRPRCGGPPGLWLHHPVTSATTCTTARSRAGTAGSRKTRPSRGSSATSPTRCHRALLLIVWDECDDPNGGECSGPMPMFVVSAPSLLTSGHAVGTALSHSSTVRSIQELLGVSPSETDPTTGKPFPWLGHAGDVNTNDLASFFAAGQFP